MSVTTQLIYNLLRIMTPEEIGDIATKHNGGKFLSLTDLVNERVEKNVHRDFSSLEYMDEVGGGEGESEAKILPFKPNSPLAGDNEASEAPKSLSELADSHALIAHEQESIAKEEFQHAENENMSSFILIEKERLKRSQKVLKQKEIIDMYQKNSNVDVEQIRGSNRNFTQSSEAGVLVNKKQF